MKTLAEEIKERARPIKAFSDLSPLIESVTQSRAVMLGEASHGTREFYLWRRLITQELIEKHGYRFIAVEGDWPPCQVVNQFVRGEDDRSAESVLRSFQRWPTWMWANTEIVKLINWVRAYNQNKSENEKVGFYGLDVYSLFESIDEAIHLAQRIDPILAERLEGRYSCFDPYMQNEKAYVRSLAHDDEGCEEEVLSNLKDLLEKRLQGASRDHEILFDATQNARIVKNAEHYYRSMIHADDESWNIRDRHMMETLNLLVRRFEKGIVWEHNTHIGDYRATSMLEHGHINIGGLAREEWGEKNVALVGFGTYHGTVMASHAWAGRPQVMLVPEGMPGSYEEEFHFCAPTVGSLNYYLLMDAEARESALNDRRGHRAIGVVYDPSIERHGNYVPTQLARRYDAFIFLDQTQALTPLASKTETRDFPETYPTGM